MYNLLLLSTVKRINKSKRRSTFLIRKWYDIGSWKTFLISQFGSSTLYFYGITVICLHAKHPVCHFFWDSIHHVVSHGMSVEASDCSANIVSISFSRKLRIWSHLLKKSVMKNFIFCAVLVKPFVMLYVRWNEHRYTTVESKNNYLENPRII